MRRLKILCIILLVTFFTSGVTGFVTDFAKGWFDGVSVAKHMVENKLQVREYIALDMNTDLMVLPQNNAMNTISGDSIVITSNNISVYEFAEDFAPLSTSQKAFKYTLGILNWLIIVIYVVIAVVFAKIMIRFTRAKVFEPYIIRLLNHTGLWFLLLGTVVSLWEVGRHYLASVSVGIEGASFSFRNCIDWESFIIGLVILVMTEILRQATTIKEEQDLTI